MKILALEFSSAQRSVAVVQKDELAPPPKQESWYPEFENIIVSEIVSAANNLTAPMHMVNEALEEGQIEREEIGGIVVGLGPGSYTGIRGAIALAQGWQLARKINLLGISSVECIVARACEEGLDGRVNVVIDAQRDEFYVAVYELDATRYREVEPLQIVSKAEIRGREVLGETLIGPEIKKWFSKGKELFPRAETMAKMSWTRKHFVSGEDLEPIYLRETNFIKAPPSRIL
jgi:tRNA threonylcarbamoyl adenosine modification protein YeaZ